MSQLGAPPTPPPYSPPTLPPPSRPQSSDIPGWVVVTAAALAFAVAGMLAFVVVNGRAGTPAAAPARARHHYPRHWNHKIAPLARIAQKQRGLTFKHPIAVRFLSPTAYRKSMRKDDGDGGSSTRKDRRQIAEETGFLRALGLIGGNVDLRRAFDDTEAAGTAAYYSFKTRSITIRGRRLTPEVKDTIVHELTHGLQDQNFQVGARMAALDKQTGRDSSAGEILDAVVEGDAVRMQDAYRDSLPVRQRRALDREANRESAQADHGLAHVPAIVVSMFTSPYALGPGLVGAAAQLGGNAGVDRLLRHTPAHEIALLDPFQALSGRTGATLAFPAVPSGDKRFDRGEFGALGWDWLLSERLPLRQALSAADGWGADSYVAYDHGGRSCTRIDFRGRTASDTATMDTALHQWAAAAPGAPALVTRRGGVLQLQSCDPGGDFRTGPDHSMAALHLAATRTGLGIGLVRLGLQSGVATCLAGRLVDDYPASDLNDPSYGVDNPAFQEHVHELELSCE